MREVLRNLMFLAVFVILGAVFLCSCVATMEWYSSWREGSVSSPQFGAAALICAGSMALFLRLCWRG